MATFNVVTFEVATFCAGYFLSYRHSEVVTRSWQRFQRRHAELATFSGGDILVSYDVATFDIAPFEGATYQGGDTLMWRHLKWRHSEVATKVW